jgi:hypothetical protein
MEGLRQPVSVHSLKNLLGRAANHISTGDDNSLMYLLGARYILVPGQSAQANCAKYWGMDAAPITMRTSSGRFFVKSLDGNFPVPLAVQS